MENDVLPPAELKLMVPTYYGTAYPDEVHRGEIGDHGEPRLPLLVREDRGIRITLGSHEENGDEPDLLVERHPNGWLLFIHGEGGCDPCGYVFILDGGRCYLMRDDVSTIRVLGHGDERPYRMKLKPLPPANTPTIIEASEDGLTS